jgi:dipeptidyl aminopeptidase/acylaminoacyl peptidase
MRNLRDEIVMSIREEDIDKIAEAVVKKLLSDKSDLMHWVQSVNKTSDDALMHLRLKDIANVNKVVLTGPPSQYQPSSTAQGAGNRVVFSSYTFTPNDAMEGEKYPLIVLPHGGVHSSFGSATSNIIKELVLQGYLVIAPEYRGSTGYGKDFYELIDYGGLETEDCLTARDYMVENCELVDSNRVGIIGWSHGGLNTVWSAFKYPDSYRVAYAGVPVSDIIARIGYKSDYYKEMFAAPYHIGKTAYEDVSEYKRRSPAWNAVKLKIPLLIHSTENDQDVNFLEVTHLVEALIAAGNEPGKDFWYKIYPPTPAAHTFNRTDERFALGVRGEVYEFLSKYLNPPKSNPLKKYISTPNPLKGAIVEK